MATPALVITLLMIVSERMFDLGLFDPSRGGDPILFQHMFWFYSHPAVYIMVGGMVSAFFAGLHFWWPKITGRMYSEGSARAAALLMFVGFNFTLFPQFILGYLEMPRRYWSYPPEFQVLNVMSSFGALILAAAYLLPMVYFPLSLWRGRMAGNNPWARPGWNGPQHRHPRARISSNARLWTKNPTPITLVTNNRPSAKIGPESVRTGQTFRRIGRGCPQRTVREPAAPARRGRVLHLDIPCRRSDFFGVMFTGYTMYRFLYPVGFHAVGVHTDIVIGTANTAILLTSSAAMTVAIWAGRAGLRRHLQWALSLTALLGFSFFVLKGFEYAEDIHKALVPGPGFPIAELGAEIFFCFCWIMTAVHGVHLTVGVAAVVLTVFWVWRGRVQWRDTGFLLVLGLYWRLIDLI